MCFLVFVDVRNTSTVLNKNMIYIVDGVLLGVTDGVTVVYGDVTLYCGPSDDFLVDN